MLENQLEYDNSMIEIQLATTVATPRKGQPPTSVAICRPCRQDLNFLGVKVL